MMYPHRTQIYLSLDEKDALDAASKQTGASRAELIRRAVRLLYGEPTASDRAAALHTSAGAWAERNYTGADYVEAARGEANSKVSVTRKS
jgi:Ribbon-helix-helix protein, copG family